LFDYKHTEIEIKKGDITEESADAIVNAANNSLLMGGGVAASIRDVGGRRIQEEAAEKGPISIGEAIETGAGNLYARYVIHAAVMGMDLRTDYRRIQTAMESVLNRADQLGISTIVFPAFGTGVGRFPPEEAAEAMLEVLKKRIDDGRCGLSRVTFTLWTDEILDIFNRTADKLFARNKED
jgi:O-acetyl-ADP-ribose deacetylase